MRHDDGSAGDANYGPIGEDYTRYRRPDPRIAAAIERELGNGRTILNVGAGAGSYEPAGRDVTAVEPPAAMRSNRSPGARAAIDAVAEDLPFADDAFDGSMAIFTVHQWRNLERGLAEIRRVTRGPVVIMTCDPLALDRFWLFAYAPEVIEVEARRYPSISTLERSLGRETKIVDVSIPLDCVDGFNEAYFGRPERLLERGVRLACSAWSFVEAATIERFERDLRADLASGAWDARYGFLRKQAEFAGSLRLVVGR